MKLEIDPEKEILRIQEELGIPAKVMGKLMGITNNTYYKKKNPDEPGHSFNLNNYLKLTESLIQYGKDLEKRVKDQGLDQI